MDNKELELKVKELEAKVKDLEFISTELMYWYKSMEYEMLELKRDTIYCLDAYKKAISEGVDKEKAVADLIKGLYSPFMYGVLWRPHNSVIDVLNGCANNVIGAAKFLRRHRYKKIDSSST